MLDFDQRVWKNEDKVIFHFESEFQQQNVANDYDHQYTLHLKSEYCQKWKKH